MYDLKEKVSIITGGANGIGAATVGNFLKEGAKFVAFLDIDEKSGNALENELVKSYGRHKAKFFKCDVTRDEELFTVYKYVTDNHGHVDVVVNNAAILNDEMYKKEIEINFTALVTSTLKALEIMRKDRGGKGGTIINISSIGALVQISPAAFIYCATKSAIMMFSNTMGMDGYFSKTGVRVLTLCYGNTQTDIIPQAKYIDEVCEEAIRAVCSLLPQQTTEAAANGLTEAYKKGASGSTWLVTDNTVTDITERVTKGYQVISGEITI